MTTTNLELTMGERLLTYRRRRGLQLRDVARAAEAILPMSMSISRETIRRMEVGAIPEAKANPVHVAALAEVYGVGVGDISASAAEALDGVRGLLTRSTGCTDHVVVGRAA